MLKKVVGIIINETNYGETSKIVNILTREGVIGAIAKGAKSVKSPLRTTTLNLTYGNFNIYYNESKLSTIKSVDVIDELKIIKKDIVLISYMSFLCDLTSQVIKQNNRGIIFDLLLQTLLKINDGLNPMIMTNILELKLLDYLGVGISFNSCCKCGSTKSIVTIDPDAGGYICKKCYTNEICYDEKTLKMLRMYYLVDINSISKLQISDRVIHNINYFINTYYDRYTGLYLKSKTFLNSLLSKNDFAH